MTIQWTFLLLAAALLLPPTPLFGSLRKSALNPRRNAGVKSLALWVAWPNWIDLLRAAGGAYLLTHGAFLTPAGLPATNLQAAIIQGCVVGLALLIQMIRFSRGPQFLGPAFYLSGITLIFSGYVAGGFAVFVGWLFALGSGKPKYQIPLMGVALVGAGYVLNQMDLGLILNSALIVVPMGLSFLFRLPLLYVGKEPPRLSPQ